MGNIGITSRASKMLQIVKGSELVSGIKQTAAYAIPASKVFSGEPIIASMTEGTSVGDANTFAFAKLTTGTINKGDPIYFAFTDSDSFDCVASGKLLGISVLDTYELQTPLFNIATNFQPGDKLTVVTGGKLVKDTSGNVAVHASSYSVQSGETLLADNVSYLDKLSATPGTYDIVGTVTEGTILLKNNAAVAGASGIGSSGSYVGPVDPSGYVNSGSTLDGVVTGGPALWTEATGSKYVLQFATTWQPGVVVS